MEDPESERCFVHKPKKLGPNHSSRSWIFRCQYDVENKRFIMCKNEDHEEGQYESILMYGEIAQSVVEYAPNELIVFVKPTNLLLVKNWQNIREI